MKISINNQYLPPTAQSPAIAAPYPSNTFNFGALLPEAPEKPSPASEATPSITAANSTLNHFLVNLKKSKTTAPQNKQRKQR